MSICTDFEKQQLFGIDFDVVTMHQTVNWVFRKAAIGRQSHCRFVITPDLDLALKHQNESDIRRIVHHADLTVCDAQPLVHLSTWFKKRLPERISGSDLVFQIFEAAVSEMPVKVFLLGATDKKTEIHSDRIHQRWNGIQVVGMCCPDQGRQNQDRQNHSKQNQQLLKQINDSEADVLIIGPGMAQQEAWAFDHRFDLDTAIALCVGDPLDFLAEPQSGPVAAMKRIVSYPSGLAKRYLKGSLRLPSLILDELSYLCPVYEQDRADVVESHKPEQKTTVQKTSQKKASPPAVNQQARQAASVKPQKYSQLKNATSSVACKADGNKSDAAQPDAGILLFADYLRAQQNDQDSQ